MRTRRQSRLAALGAASLGLALLAGCGGSTTEGKRPKDAQAAALFDSAKKEKDVSVYSVLEDTLNKRLSDSYGADVGLPVSIEKIAGASVNARYEAEAAGDAVRADIVISSDCAFIKAQIDKGSMVDLASAGIPGYPGDYPQEFQIDGGAIPIVQMNPWGIGYNTNKVRKGDVPTSWDELVDPKWKGKILMVSPKSSASQVQMWNYLIDTRGEEFAKKLASQAAQFYPSTGPAAEALAAGEGDLLIPTAAQVTFGAAEAGAPTAFSALESTTSSWICVGLSKDAPSPKGARLFLSHLLSESGSNALNGDADLGTVGAFGSGAHMPGDYTPPQPVTQALTDYVYGAIGS
jgi:iron(III) transport system substrate-binding protein